MPSEAPDGQNVGKKYGHRIPCVASGRNPAAMDIGSVFAWRNDCCFATDVLSRRILR
ncbi:MAG: hypothetical protein SFY80_04825 [Verrucomicrobiota bacterium]|nr:hypothetical protein [Verrucomicrobiota bacterium]